MRYSKRFQDRMYFDGLSDVAKGALKVITFPLKVLGRTGMRIIKIASDAVKWIMFLKTTHDAYDWINARSRLKGILGQLEWSQGIIDTAMDEGMHKINVEHALKLLKNTVVMALAEVTSRLASRAAQKLDW